MLFASAIEFVFFIAAFFYVTYLLLFLKLIRYKSNFTSLNSTEVFVSVLICAKNEANQLSKNLPMVLLQKEISYEVIVVNDQSEDDTQNILNNFQQKFAHLKVYQTKGKSNKKKALQLAKSKSSGHVYVLTDADCKVNSDVWLKLMVSNLNHQHAVVLGYGPYISTDTFLNKLQRFETLTTAMQYFTAALYGNAYMGVGRNLAYSKNLDQNIQFTSKQEKILSGDDDLWIQQAKRLTKFHIQLNQKSFAYSHAKSSWAAWWHQKRRHITTANAYTLLDQILLSVVFIVKFLFWFSFIWLLFYTSNFLIWFIFLLAYTTMLVIYKLTCARFKEAGLYSLSPFLDFILICFQLCFFISNLVTPLKKWK